MIEINRNPSPRELRWFGLLQFAFFGMIVWLNRKTGHPQFLGAVLVVSLLIAAIAVAAPARLRGFYVAWMMAVFPIGWTVSHLLLAAIFYLVVTPVGLLMRLSGRDPMHREFDRNAATYWVPRPAEPPAKRYFRQF